MIFSWTAKGSVVVPEQDGPVPAIVGHDTALNHPNIATIHGLEQSEGVHYLVMELVLGETLAERLRAGTLSVKEALRICGRIASASGMTSVRASSRYRSRPG